MNNKTSNIPLLAAFGIGLIFMWLVGYGWYRTFNSWTGNGYISIPIGIIFSLIAATLALAIAKERTTNSDNISTAVSYFFILILLSALGTINTLYFNVSGVSIAQNEIKNANYSFEDSNFSNSIIFISYNLLSSIIFLDVQFCSREIN